MGVNTPEYSVSEISGAVKRMIEGEFAHVRIRGELGRVMRHRSGHVYLDLKDERAVLSGVIWKGVAARLEIRPQEGDEVVATGRLTTFPGQSKYQLVIENLAYAGAGALLAKLERLKQALAAEGLFAAERKRKIPFLPQTIGVVTSPSGAVIRDILHRVRERFPVRVVVWPVAVQGPPCAPQVAAAIRGFSALAAGGPVPRPDVLIVARGGGSVEDLWGFNEEAVVRAAADCTIPLISAVGHETDTTLIDHAADLRAPTPTAAAECAVPVRAELLACAADLGARKTRALTRLVHRRRESLAACARALPRPDQLLGERRQRLDLTVVRLSKPERLVEDRRQALRLLAAHMPSATELVARRQERLRLLWAKAPPIRETLVGPMRAFDRAAGRLAPALRAVAARGGQRLARIEGRLSPLLVQRTARTARARLAPLATRLDPVAARRLREAQARMAGLTRLLGSLGYRETLARGFTVVRDAAGQVTTSASGVRAGMALEIEFADGRRGVTADEPPAAPLVPPRAARPRGRKTPEDESQGSLF